MKKYCSITFALRKIFSVSIEAHITNFIKMTANSSSISGMKNDYNDNSNHQKLIINAILPFIREAIDLYGVSDLSDHLIIADFGSAQGANSIYLMNYIIQYLKETNKIKDEKSILVVHNDLPTNDWTILFNLLEKNNSYCALASGKSFYEQCLLSNSLSVGVSCSSLHWLSRKPCNLSSHCFANLAHDPIERESFREQFKYGLTSFLRHRSRELVINGVLIITFFSADNDGHFGINNIVNTLYECAKTVGLTKQELIDYTYPSFAPFHTDCIDKKLFEQYSLKLIKAEFHGSDYYASNQYQNNQLSADEYSKVTTAFVRSWGEPSLKKTFEINGRSKDEIDGILKQFWMLYEETIRKNPNKYTSYYYNTLLICQKYRENNHQNDES